MEKQWSDLGFLRIASVSPEHRVADPVFNLGSMLEAMEQGIARGCRLFLFPELGITGYSCGDLFFQPRLLEGAKSALRTLIRRSGELGVTLVAGAPLLVDERLYNAAFFISCGKLTGVVPKTSLPNTQEFYEARWFCSGDRHGCSFLDWDGEPVPFGADLLFRAEDRSDCLIGIEICEDLWSVVPPSSLQALAGASVLLNLSASPEVLGKVDYRRSLVQSQSARCLAAYVYAGAGPGESTTDLVFSGHSLIAENGRLLSETERFDFETGLTLADLDLDLLRCERLKNSSFAAGRPGRQFRMLPFHCGPGASMEAPLLRPVNAMPFVPAQLEERDSRCSEIFRIQTTGLRKRLRHLATKNVVIGLSGGLDSTLALLVTAQAFDALSLPRRNIHALTMPGFGTTGRTRTNAQRLAELLGVSLRVVSIDAAVRQHFADIGHDGKTHDVTFENSQARERTQILMDVANQVGGLVIGTGDLSELALGWCTYNGDHMSMYAVNCGVPKTLVRYLVDWCAKTRFTGETAEVLEDICDTPISPELLPPDSSDGIAQMTEEQVGPYALHDFFLFQVVRMGASPAKVFHLAALAFDGQFERAEILRWLRVFYRRFFSQQFKRSCLPDGPKVGSIALSPRGDWRMPSDACAALWLEELESCEP